MTNQTSHGKLLAAAAKRVLVPIGCRRKGQSRTWVSDERSWLIVVEFQPSGFSRGSYLNVAPMWLWRLPKFSSLTFDYGPVRVADFAEFHSEEQFEAEADALANRAATEILSFRKLLNSPDAITRCLIEAAESGLFWPSYHAAVAAGLLGQTSISRKLFARVIDNRRTQDLEWVRNVQSRCGELASKLSDISAFRSTINEMVQRTRMGNKLPCDATCLENWFL